jgi:hypothetical protein
VLATLLSYWHLILSGLAPLLRPLLGLMAILLLAMGMPQYLFNQEEFGNEPSQLAAMTSYCLVLLGGALFLRTLLAWGRETLLLAIPISLYFFIGFWSAIFNDIEAKDIVMALLPYAGYGTFPATLALINSHRRLHLILKTVLFGCCLGCFGALVEYLLGIGVAYRGYIQVRSSVGQIGALLGIIAWVASVLAFRHRLPFSRLLLVLLSFLFLGTWLVTLNKTIMIVTPLAVVTLVFLLSTELAISGLIKGVVFFLVVGLTLLSVNSDFFGQGALGSIREIDWIVDEGRRDEFELLTSENIWSLLFGHGFGASWFSRSLQREFFSCHNFFIQVFWQTGLVGSAVLLSFTTIYVSNFRKIARRSELSKNSIILRSIAVSFLLGLVFMSAFQNRFTILHHTPLIGFILALPLLSPRVTGGNV